MINLPRILAEDWRILSEENKKLVTKVEEARKTSYDEAKTLENQQIIESVIFPFKYLKYILKDSIDYLSRTFAHH